MPIAIFCFSYPGFILIMCRRTSLARLFIWSADHELFLVLKLKGSTPKTYLLRAKVL